MIHIHKYICLFHSLPLYIQLYYINRFYIVTQQLKGISKFKILLTSYSNM